MNNALLWQPQSPSLHLFILPCPPLISDVSYDQQTLWRETTDDSPSVEVDVTTGGTEPIEVNKELLCDIQRLVSRLASKTSQLIGNFTTTLAENWMNITAKLDGEKMFNRSQAGSWEF